jgi:hypothetical protein
MLRLWKLTSVSIGALLLENIEGRSFPRAFERRDTYIYLEEFYKKFERCVKKTL